MALRFAQLEAHQCRRRRPPLYGATVAHQAAELRRRGATVAAPAMDRWHYRSMPYSSTVPVERSYCLLVDERRLRRGRTSTAWLAGLGPNPENMVHK